MVLASFFTKVEVFGRKQSLPTHAPCRKDMIGQKVERTR